MTMKAHIRPAIVLLTLFTFVTGIIYPLFVLGFAQIIFPNRANGSIVTQQSHAVGSSLIGQPFSAPRYFWGRLSATSSVAYNASNSSGSNLGPSNQALVQQVRSRLDALQNADSTSRDPVPVDLVTASASGLDPHISIAAALYQVRRIAHERQLPDTAIAALVNRFSELRAMRVLGEPRVNVLELNLALDEQFQSRGDQ
jgi:K+-transporting ATPase ATPase C chain